jgi:hypothetical protein
LTVTAPVSGPVPPSVPPATVTVVDASELLTTNVPASTEVEPV